MFNEADLLKCLGRLSLLIHDRFDGNVLELKHDRPEEGFVVGMEHSDGSIHVENLRLAVKGRPGTYTPFRPLNSRASWPLYIAYADGNVVRIFDAAGDFSEEFSSWAGFHRRK